MRKLLAIVQPNGTGFRGYVPRLPGCEAFGATEAEVEANLTTAVRKHLSEPNGEGINPEEVQVIVAVEAPRPPRPSDKGLAAIYDQVWRPFSPEELESFLDVDEQEGLSFEELMRELGFDVEEQATDQASE